ncbi:MAG TPA: protein kinase [Streptosporangiaceae bacterium]|nr:protein kinase [Streptosporangiaceae bacterium]
MHALAGAGRVVGGRYRLRDQIGRGAMGTVWRARDELLDRDVAVKEVQVPPALGEPDRRALYQRTFREAKTAARLSHPAVVTVFDVVEEDSRPWIVMELVRARSLDRVLAEDGPLPTQQAADVGQQLVGALATAHAAGVLHRDVKPSNVLLSPDGRAVLTDFGIATFEGDAGLTQTGMVMGTPAFTAPERIRGEPATPSSDLWSLGATLYAAVQGRGPYQERGGALTTMNAVINEDAPAAASAGRLGPVIAALMHKDPAARPDAATAAKLLSGVFASRPALGPSEPAAPRALATASPATTQPAPPAGALPYFQSGTLPAPAWPAPGSPLRTFPSPVAQSPAAQSPAAPSPATQSPATQSPAAPYPPLSSPFSSSPPYQPSAAPYQAPTTPYQSQAAAYRPSVPAYQPPAVLHPPRQYGQAGSPQEGPPGGGRPGRRTFLVGCIIAAVVLGGLLVTAALARHRSPGRSNAAQDKPATGPSSSGGRPSHSAGGGAPALPAGYTWYSQPAASTGTTAGFRLAVPLGWNVTRNGLTTYIRSPSGGRFMEVDLTPQTYRPAMTEARWLQMRTRQEGKFPGYRRISIRPVSVHGTSGAEWTFTWLEPGVGRVVARDYLFNLNTDAGTQSYALYASAPLPTWPSAAPLQTEALTTFHPLP